MKKEFLIIFVLFFIKLDSKSGHFNWQGKKYFCQKDRCKETCALIEGGNHLGIEIDSACIQNCQHECPISYSKTPISIRSK